MMKRNRIVLRNNVLSAVELDALISHLRVASDIARSDKASSALTAHAELKQTSEHLEELWRNRRGGVMLSRATIASIHRQTSGARRQVNSSGLDAGERISLRRVLNAIDALLPPRY